MNKKVILAQLAAIQASAEALILIVSEDEFDEEPAICPHPVGDRIDHSTMGVSRWICGACGYEHGFEEGD